MAPAGTSDSAARVIADVPNKPKATNKSAFGKIALVKSFFIQQTVSFHSAEYLAITPQGHIWRAINSLNLPHPLTLLMAKRNRKLFGLTWTVLSVLPQLVTASTLLTLGTDRTNSVYQVGEKILWHATLHEDASKLSAFAANVQSGLPVDALPIPRSARWPSRQ